MIGDYLKKLKRNVAFATKLKWNNTENKMKKAFYDIISSCIYLN